MGNLFSEVTCKPDVAAAALHREDGSALARRLTPVQWLVSGMLNISKSLGNSGPAKFL
jgi:hypothetical protein